MNVGITGHQDLSQYNIQWIIDCLDELIDTNQTTKGYSSLANGADQLFVKALIKRNITYDAVIPCKLYEGTFQKLDERNEYFDYLKKADRVLLLNYNEPSQEAFYDAGKKIVDLCDLLFAVWNGKKARGLGGTADVVAYSKTIKRNTFHLNPVTQKISMF